LKNSKRSINLRRKKSRVWHLLSQKAIRALIVQLTI